MFYYKMIASVKQLETNFREVIEYVETHTSENTRE